MLHNKILIFYKKHPGKLISLLELGGSLKHHNYNPVPAYDLYFKEDSHKSIITKETDNYLVLIQEF